MTNVINLFNRNAKKNRKSNNERVLAGLRTGQRISRLNKDLEELREHESKTTVTLESSSEKGLLIDVDYSHGRIFFVSTEDEDIVELRGDIDFMISNLHAEEYWSFLEDSGYHLGVATWQGLFKAEIGTELELGRIADSEDEEIQYNLLNYRLPV